MATRCRCVNTCPDGSIDGTCYLKPGGFCFEHVEAVLDEADRAIEQIRLGCFPPAPEGLLQCRGSLVPHAVPQKTFCCSSHDFCNANGTSLKLDPYVIEELNKDHVENPFNFTLYLILLISFVIALIGILTVLYLYRRKKSTPQEKEFEKNFCESDDSMEKIGNFPFESTHCKPLLAFPYQKNFEYNNLISPRPPINFNTILHSSTTSDSGSCDPPFKYQYLNNSHSSNTNESNCSINQYRNFSSSSNTTSSIASEITQQTTLSSQKPSLPPLDENSVTSGSGSGIPHLIQQTLAREIQLMECIGKGRYGNVYRGIRKGDNMAAKIFFSRDEASWKREIEIYTTVIMRQDNILGFFGADVTSQNGCTELWLVTEYCSMGSLFDYLSLRPITCLDQLLSVMKSIVSGLEHLHTEVIGTLGKPAIAHRDIKSKNILMKSDYSCCIADFGLAVIKTEASHININIAQNHRVGTKRYMAPEVLNETMKSDIFESYRAADIYSLSLVFWELFNRLQFNGICNDYHVPYFNLVQADPSFEEMRQVVCFDQLRPSLNQEFLDNLILNDIAKLMQECWNQNPAARLSSLRIKKSIMTLIQELANN